jgi:hypothetical protein
MHINHRGQPTCCGGESEWRAGLLRSVCVCELSFGGNINVVREGYDRDCRHHDLEVLNNPVPPLSTPGGGGQTHGVVPVSGRQRP